MGGFAVYIGTALALVLVIEGLFYGLFPEAARRMTPGGRIINMSSMESIRPSGPSSSHYNITKGAVNAMTRAAAVDRDPERSAGCAV